MQLRSVLLGVVLVFLGGFEVQGRGDSAFPPPAGAHPPCSHVQVQFVQEKVGSASLVPEAPIHGLYILSFLGEKTKKWKSGFVMSQETRREENSPNLFEKMCCKKFTKFWKRKIIFSLTLWHAKGNGLIVKTNKILCEGKIGWNWQEKQQFSSFQQHLPSSQGHRAV